MVRANAYQQTEFQLPSSISFGDMKGVLINKNWGLLISQTPPSENILHGDIVPENAYQYTKFQLPSSISFGDRE